MMTLGDAVMLFLLPVTLMDRNDLGQSVVFVQPTPLMIATEEASTKYGCVETRPPKSLAIHPENVVALSEVSSCLAVELLTPGLLGR